MNFKRILGLIALVCVLACTLSCVVACDTAAGGDETTAESTDAATTVETTEPETTEEETTKGKLPHEILGEEETTEDTRTQYTIKVVDAEGNAIAGVAAQYCTEESCSFGTSNADGVITFKSDITDPTAYYIVVKMAPDGYAFDESYKFYFDENYEAIVTLAASEA